MNSVERYMNSVERYIIELDSTAYDFDSVVHTTELDLFVSRRVVLFEKIGHVTTGYYMCELEFDIIQEGSALTLKDFESIYDMFA